MYKGFTCKYDSLGVRSSFGKKEERVKVGANTNPLTTFDLQSSPEQEVKQPSLMEEIYHTNSVVSKVMGLENRTYK